MKMAKFYAGLQNQTDIYSVKLLSANQIPSTKVSAGDTEISVNLSLFWSLGCPNGYLLFFLIKFWKQSCAILQFFAYYLLYIISELISQHTNRKEKQPINSRMQVPAVNWYHFQELTHFVCMFLPNEGPETKGGRYSQSIQFLNSLWKTNVSSECSFNGWRHEVISLHKWELLYLLPQKVPVTPTGK